MAGQKTGGRAAAEIVAILRANPERGQGSGQARERAREQQALEWRHAESPLVAELRAAGFDVQSAWDLVPQREAYPAAIPILLRHLMQSYPERVREGIARALAVPDSHIGWRVLSEAFRREDGASTTGVKWAIALALGASGTDDELDEVLGFLRDESHGRNRAPLLKVLGRSAKPEAREMLIDLSKDPSLAEDAKRALRMQRHGGRKRQVVR